MSGTKRTRRRPPKRPQFTPKVLALFEQAEQINRRRSIKDCVPDDSVYPERRIYCAHSSCKVCREWHDVAYAIARELNYAPWEDWSVLPFNPYVAGSERAKNWLPDPDSRQHALWVALSEALAESKVKEAAK